MFVWDEKKREANLVKHGFDFEDAGIIYFDPKKFTRNVMRKGEKRHADTAFVELYGIHLTLIFTDALETSGLSPTASLQDRRDWIIRNSTSRTDWARVFAEADSDAPIAYNPDDDDDMYDPNDDAAVEAS